MPSPSHSHRHTAHRRQRGVYALEWAIIFPVFFALLYAIISYGLTFLVRESMQFAVEEGARSALRYPIGVVTPTWEHRKQTAVQTVKESLSWLPADLKPSDSDIKFTVCLVSDIACNNQTALNPSINCDVSTPCLVIITYSIQDYPSKAIAPPLPGFKLFLPASLTSSGSILSDRRMM